MVEAHFKNKNEFLCKVPRDTPAAATDPRALRALRAQRKFLVPPVFQRGERSPPHRRPVIAPPSPRHRPAIAPPPPRRTLAAASPPHGAEAGGLARAMRIRRAYSSRAAQALQLVRPRRGGSAPRR
mmetsp:Transcript_4835/g.11785  ORF Transcript_4835/g.11785 Transcript_4835/m.11785 type:complete len:126 (+) Transcript_4835:251-628(+)